MRLCCLLDQFLLKNERQGKVEFSQRCHSDSRIHDDAVSASAELLQSCFEGRIRLIVTTLKCRVRHLVSGQIADHTDYLASCTFEMVEDVIVLSVLAFEEQADFGVVEVQDEVTHRYFFFED